MQAEVPFAFAFVITLRLSLERGRGPRPELGEPLGWLQLSAFSVTLRTYIGRLLCHLVFFSCVSQSESQSQTLGRRGPGEGRAEAVAVGAGLNRTARG